MTTSNSYSEIFRPKTPEQLIGETQRQVAQVLVNKAKNKKDLVREVMLIGESGTGKTTIGKMYIQALLGKSDLTNFIHELNCAADTGIDFIRSSVRDRLHYLPLGADYSIFFLNEVHKLSTPAQESLLEEIEPLPSHVVMICTTNQPEKLVATFRSRFDKYTLPIPTQKDFEKKAWWIYSKIYNGEAKDRFAKDKSTIDEIIGVSRGNVRDFDRYIQQLIEGGYNTVVEEEEPKSKLFDIIFRGQLNLNEMLKEAETEKDRVTTVEGLCGYAIKVLINNNTSQPIAIRSRKVLSIFGDGLDKNISARVSFAKKLVELSEK